MANLFSFRRRSERIFSAGATVLNGYGPLNVSPTCRAHGLGRRVRCNVFAHFLTMQGSAMLGSYSSSLADPPGSSVVVAAVQWPEGTLLGTIATTIAVITVASIGLMALTGRVDLRRAGTAILGCFILFGASSIAAGLERMARDGGAYGSAQPQMVASDVSPLTRPPAPRAGYPLAMLVGHRSRRVRCGNRRSSSAIRS